MRTMILTTTPDNDDDVTDCDNNDDHVIDHDDQDNDFDDQDTLECSLQTVLPHRDQLARRVFMFRSLQSTILELLCWR